jgi:hypothetical protein
MDCDKFSFSQDLSRNRIAQAKSILGEKVVDRILCYALFLLGANRTEISDQLAIPPGTVRSLFRRVNNRGITAFCDQRGKIQSPTNIVHPKPFVPELRINDTELGINLKSNDLVLVIPEANKNQKKVVLLTLLNSKILKRSDVAQALDLSEDRTGKLAKKLVAHDVNGVIDQRRGQQQDFRYTPRIKAEMIQQFVIDIVTERKTSGRRLAQNLDERCQLKLSPRSILHHFSKLGLSQIKSSLPVLLEETKKKF